MFCSIHWVWSSFQGRLGVEARSWLMGYLTAALKECFSNWGAGPKPVATTQVRAGGGGGGCRRTPGLLPWRTRNQTSQPWDSPWGLPQTLPFSISWPPPHLFLPFLSPQHLLGSQHAGPQRLPSRHLGDAQVVECYSFINRWVGPKKEFWGRCFLGKGHEQDREGGPLLFPGSQLSSLSCDAHPLFIWGHRKLSKSSLTSSIWVFPVGTTRLGLLASGWQSHQMILTSL